MANNDTMVLLDNGNVTGENENMERIKNQGLYKYPGLSRLLVLLLYKRVNDMHNPVMTQLNKHYTFPTSKKIPWRYAKPTLISPIFPRFLISSILLNKDSGISQPPSTTFSSNPIPTSYEICTPKTKIFPYPNLIDVVLIVVIIASRNLSHKRKKECIDKVSR